MRIIFAGSPATAIPSLDRLIQDHEVIAVLTRPPAPVGRKKILTPSAVDDAARSRAIPVLTPSSLRNPDVEQQLIDLAPDAIAVVAYGLLIPENLLSVPRYGWINLHYSLLPRWRGAAPVQYAIAAGDQTTGTSVFQIETGLDTGPVFDVEEVAIGRQTSGELLTQLSQSGAHQLARVLTAIEEGNANAVPQEGEVTVAPQLSASDAYIDFSWDAAKIDAHIRAYTPQPGPWALRDGQRVKLGPVTITDVTDIPAGHIVMGKRVLVGSATTALELSTVTPAGKKMMAASDWVRGLGAQTLSFDVEGVQL
ncbi:methionyl-tRNA formyltransferase [Arcanobacterium pinnipediorum]|uniref:Methionyl-tRNA formyltransferase n=1 Tax=Arcanobacterium pinnipediorum TaxID=1503041 RepID=A0ABY5AJC1_9ACTO|nr:methionyl-tRNA formyltransferase [Arcanobacterium pinnipediorum]USR80197.1 methionyl-tRNA formyltransferase [Arcanobacterium pinnipediorum]